MEKINFNAVVFTGNDEIGNNGYIKYRNQSSFKRFLSFLDTKYPKWAFLWLTDKKNGQKRLVKRSSS